jgi:uncharacterized membrane protein HdeD (DUF308 family)
MTDVTPAFERGRSRPGMALRGSIALLISLYLLFRPAASVAAFALAVAFWVLVDGVIHVADSFGSRRGARFWWVTLLNGLLGIGIGVAALYFYPIVSLTYAIIWCGVWLLAAGVASFSASVGEMRDGQSWGWAITLGVAALLTALFVMLHPAMTIRLLVDLIVLYGLVAGATLLIGAVDYRGNAARRDAWARR